MIRKILLLTLSFILLFDLTVSQTLAAGSEILIYPLCYDGKPAAQIILPAYFGSNIKTPFNYVWILRRAPGYTSTFPVQKVSVDNNASPVKVIDKGLEFSRHYTYNFIAVKKNHWFDNPNLPVNTSETTIDTLSYDTAASCKNSNEAPAVIPQPAGQPGTSTSFSPQQTFDNNVQYLCNDKLLNNQQKQECKAYLSQRFNQCNDEGYKTEEQLGSCGYDLKLMFIRKNAAQDQPSIHKVINDADYETLKGYYCDKGTFSEVNNPAVCVKFTDDFCSKQNDVGKFTECIITQARKAGASFSASRVGTGSSGGGTQVAPAARTTEVPQVTTPQTQKSQRRTEILNDWCAAYLGADTAKGNDCVDKADDKCKDPSLSNETIFTNCVKEVGLEMQKGITPAQGAAPSSQRQPASPQKPSGQQAVEIIPTVDGYQQVAEGTYPANTTEVTIGAKAFKAGDKNQNCLLLDLDLTLIKTADEKGNLLPPAPATRIKTLIDKEGKNAGKEVNAQTAQNCHPYIAKLVGPGTYRFFAKSGDKTSKDIAFSVGGLVPKSAEIKAFTCVTLAQASGNSISATANPNPKLDPKEGYLGYNRAAWYIKKGVSKDSDLVYDPNNKDQNKKGDNCQFEGKGESCQNANGNDPTTFDNLEENQEYTIQAAAYPSKGNKEAVACAPTKPIKTAAKNNNQVLAITSEELSAAATVLGVNVSSDGLSNIIIRSIGFDGELVDILYDERIAGDQVINVKVPNLYKVNKVETIVTPITESGERLDAKTYTIDLPDLSGVASNPTKIQSVQLSQNPQDSSFTKDALKYAPITIIAVTNLPVENPVFINTANNERFIIESQDISNNCSADNEEKCVYQINLGGELVKEDNYQFKFAQGESIFDTNPLNFTVSSEKSEESGGIEPAVIIDQGDKVITKVVLSKDDGTFQQVVYTLDQETKQGYFADAEFDLTEGINGLKYTIDYTDGTQKEIIFVVEKTVQEETTPADSPTPTESDLTPSADSGEYCSIVGDYDRVCTGDDGTYKFRQCQENNIWSDWLGSETNPEQSCRTE